MLLADFGAEVIHVEERVGGDKGRAELTWMGRSCVLPGGKAMLFETYNRNKKSIALSLSKKKGQEIVYGLVRRSHVFVQNFRAGTAAKFKLDYETVSQYNPNMVYVNGEGFGSIGPDAGLPTTDIVVQARSGFMRSYLGSTPSPEPAYLYPGLGDDVGGNAIFSAILLGLVIQQRSGRGLELHASQLGSVISTQRCAMSQYLLTGSGFLPLDRKKPTSPIFNLYKCKDGRWFLLGLFQPDKDWGTFCRVIGLAELEKDTRFDTVEKRRHASEELVAILEKVFATKTFEEWDTSFRVSGLLYTVVNSPEDLIKDAQVKENEYIFTLDHPTLGPVNMVGNPIQIGDGHRIPKSAAPEFGQHTEEILLDLGYTWEDIAALKDEEVI